MNTTNLKEVRSQCAATINQAIDKRVEELKTSLDLTSVKKQIESLENDPYTKGVYHYIDDCGLLCAQLELDLPEELKEEDREVIDSLIQSLTDFGHVNVKNDSTVTLEVCLGEPTRVNWNTRKGEYTIYSRELNLKILKVKDETHAMLLIEDAMRRAGVFGDIVSLDYYGYVNSFIHTGMGRLKDKTIKQRLKKYEDME